MKKFISGIIRIFLLICLCAGAADAEIQVDVAVEGVTGAVRDNVLSYLGIEQNKNDPYLTESILKDLHREAEKEIRSALQPFGYYSPVIRSSLEKEEGVWKALYVIDPGNPVIIKKIDLRISGDGADDERFGSVTNKIPLHTGSVLLHADYEETKNMLQKTASERGYFDAKLSTHRVDVFPRKKEAVITLYFDTGMRYRFGDVIFTQDTYSTAFLSRFIKLRKGDYFTLSPVLGLEKVLTDSDYFSEVSVTPRRDLAENGRIPIEVRLTPRKKHRFTFGIGYGTDTGVRGSAGWENRRVNRSGHRMSADLRLSEIRNSFTYKYTVPLKDPAVSHLDYSAGWRSENTDTSDSETYLAGVSRTHMRHRWQETAYINYQHERFTAADETGRSDLLIPGISWTRIKADDRVHTGRGIRLFLDLKGAHEAVISDTTFFQVRVQAKYIHSIGTFGRFIVRADGGASLLDTLSELPSSLRFYAGGDRSVRGYAYNSLGPPNSAGDVVGGKHLLAGSIEYEQKLTKNWSAAVFYDAGNAINSISAALKKGAGAGIRWKSPIGPVRVDAATALSETGQPWRLHVVIGPDL